MQSKKQLQFFLIGVVSLLMSCKKMDEPGNLVAKTVDQDASLPSITVNGRMLHAEAFGHPDSTIIVCIHGGPGADYRYMLVGKDLAAKGYRVVFYDQVGSGLSQRFKEEFYDNMDVKGVFLDELSGVIKHYKRKANQKVMLFGHSWGAIMATAYAGKYPNEIDGMVLMEPGGLKWNDIIEYISKSQSVKLWSEVLNDITYKDQFISDKKNNHDILDYRMTLLAGNGENPNTGESVLGADGFWRFGAVINLISFNLGQKLKPDLSDGIENYTRPILFVYGDNKAYSDDWAKKISAVYVNKEVFKVPGVGHSGMLETYTWQNTMLPKMLNYFNSLN